MQKLRWIWTLPFIILAVFVVIFLTLYRQPSTLDKGDDLTREVPLPAMKTMPKDQPLSSPAGQTVRANREHSTSVHGTTETSLDVPPPTDDSPTDPMLEMMAPLIEGVDSLTAAKGLKREGFLDYARQYARKAVAENPGSFEALLLLAQLLRHDGNEREATFRRLVKRNPTSVEALYGLGQTLSQGKPAEAIPYLKTVIAADPSYPSVYHILGMSYQRMGMYDEALVAHKKAYEISHAPLTLRYIQAIESGNPIIKPLQRESEEQSPEALPPEETLPESPLQEELPSAPTEEPGGETGFDDSFQSEPPESEGDTVQGAQAMEEFQRLLDKYERTITSESDPAATIERRISDLERSIESRPNRAESYLELARAYEEAGEDEKAAEVYRQARERFPDLERVRQESEAYRDKRGRSTEREDEGEYDETEEDEDDEER